MIDSEKIKTLLLQLNKPKTEVLKKSLVDFIEEAKKLDEAKHKKYDKKKKPVDVQAEYEAMLNHLDSVDEPVEKEKSIEKEDEWNVKIGDPIEYFDPELSYELTGYRPITKNKGLDFDPKLFTIAADNYIQNGVYTLLTPGTFNWINYWKEEFNKCLNGVTIGKYTLTGLNYFFLNYYRLLSPVKKKTDHGSKRAESFPVFLAKQYEYFHYLELCKRANFDGLAFKSRGVGASEIAASNCAHAFTFLKESNNVVTGFLEKYVSDTLKKTWQELDFLNLHTEGAFKRLRQKTDTTFKKVASMIDKNKNEFGWKSVVEGIVADTPDKLRGGRTDNLYFEESGNNRYLEETYGRARALVDILGTRVGNRFVFGTSGQLGPALAGLKKMFYNPKAYDILPYFNRYMRGTPQLTGYFIPSFSMWIGDPPGSGFDSRGVVYEDKAKAYYIAKWEKAENPLALIIDKAEYCFTPEDAFILEGDNLFDLEKLAEQLQALTVLKTVPIAKPFKLRWPMKDAEVDRNAMPLIEANPNGKILIAEEPLRDEHGIPFSNLYVAGIDGIDLDSTTSTGQTDVSKFCCIILRRAYGTNPPKVVAIYKDRPRHINDAYDTALKMCMFYNAKVLFEATRVGVKSYFERYNKLSLLLHRPKATANTSQKTNFRLFGAPASAHIIEHLLELIEAFISDFWYTIEFPEMLDELIAYSYANKRKFDIVAALGMVLLADEDLLGKVVRTNLESKPLQDVGYYKDEYGRICFGIILKKEISTMRYGWHRKPNY